LKTRGKISKVSTTWIARYGLSNLQKSFFCLPKIWAVALHKLTFV